MANYDEDEATRIERAGTELRMEMLRFNGYKKGDVVDRMTLGLLFASEQRFVFVPIYVDPLVPEAPADFATMFKSGTSVFLHIYTSRHLIPTDCKADQVMVYSFLDLMDDLKENGEVEFVYVDPGTDHSIGFSMIKGQQHMFANKPTDLELDQNKST
ncbi:MAG: hypothetical protein IPH21_07420 [Flavobacteriales bacterium]|nr:hypothetical protein [Flavobacteriales bacterium]